LKYVDSFKDTLTMSVKETAYYGDWFDISWANELYSFATIAGSKTITTTITVTLQRYSPIASTTEYGTDIADHSGLSATGSNEKVVSAKPDGDAAYGTNNQLGMRVRWKAISDSTWTSSQEITVTLEMHAKRN